MIHTGVLGHLLFQLVFPETRAADVGADVKAGQCEACGFEYVYQVRRKSQGRAIGFLKPDQQTAEKRAAQNLRKLLADACDPVPCPQCGWYQPDMVRRVRHLRFRSSWVIGGLLLVSSGPLMVPGLPIAAMLATDANGFPWQAMVFFIAGFVAMAATPAVVLLKFVQSRFYDPNAADVESRIQQGCGRAVAKRAYVSGTACPAAPDNPMSPRKRRLITLLEIFGAFLAS